MKKAAIAILMTSVFGLSACQQDQDIMKVEKPVLETETAKESYALGAGVGSFVQRKLAENASVGVELDKELLVKGFIAALQEQSIYSQNEIQTLTKATDEKVKEAMRAEADALGEKNLAEGEKFLAENAKREEVTVTDSGLQYEVLASAEGPKPSASDTVKVHYKGTLLDGTEFDSSYSRGEPATFPLNRVIAGWTEGLQLMNEGAKYKFYIPSDLAYGTRNTGSITPNSTLVFEVELLEIVGREATN